MIVLSPLEQQVQPVGIMGNAADAVIGRNPAQDLGKIFLPYDTRRSGCGLPALGEFFADAIPAIVDRDPRPLDAGDLIDLDCILGAAYPYASEGV